MTSCHYPNQMRYQITPSDYSALRARLTSSVQEESGENVHRMLFASYRSRMIASHTEEALAGDREDPAFSLCYFDNDPTYLLLERRWNRETDRAMVTEAECRALLAGDTDWLLESRNPLLQDFHDSITRRMLLPRVLLSYHRETYALEGRELWVALDTGIRASLQHMDFLDPELLARDTAGQEERMLMEISYSSAIPEELLCLLEETAPRRRLLSGMYLPA